MNDQALILKEIEKILVEQGSGIIYPSQAETQYWQQAHQPVIDTYKTYVKPVVKNLLQPLIDQVAALSRNHLFLDIAMIVTGVIGFILDISVIGAPIGVWFNAASTSLSIRQAQIYFEEGDNFNGGLYTTFAFLGFAGPIAKGIVSGSKYLKSLFVGAKTVDQVKVNKLITLMGKNADLTKATAGELEAVNYLGNLSAKNPNIFKNLALEGGVEFNLLTSRTAFQIGKKNVVDYFKNNSKDLAKSLAITVAAIDTGEDLYKTHVAGPKEVITTDYSYVKAVVEKFSPGLDPYSRKAKDLAWNKAKISFMSDGTGTDNTKLKNAWHDPEPYGTQESNDSFISTNRIGKDEKLDANNKPYIEAGGWRPGLPVPPKYWTSRYEAAMKRDQAADDVKEDADMPEDESIHNSLGL